MAGCAERAGWTAALIRRVGPVCSDTSTSASANMIVRVVPCARLKLEAEGVGNIRQRVLLPLFATCYSRPPCSNLTIFHEIKVSYRRSRSRSRSDLAQTVLHHTPPATQHPTSNLLFPASLTPTPHLPVRKHKTSSIPPSKPHPHISTQRHHSQIKQKIMASKNTQSTGAGATPDSYSHSHGHGHGHGAWRYSTAISIEDEDLTFNGQPLSALYEKTRASVSAGSQKQERGRKKARDRH